jgi:hypothetical protein
MEVPQRDRNLPSTSTERHQAADFMAPPVKSTVAIVGANGILAQALAYSLAEYTVTVFGQSDYDMRNANDIKCLASQLNSFAVIIYCPGVLIANAWDIFSINATAPAYLCELLTNTDCQAHVVVIGSHSGMWSSWPGIDISRLWYNLSKQTLTATITALSHSGKTKMRYTVFNACKFKSSMSNHQGIDVTVVADAIKSVIESPMPPVIYEMDSANVR